VFDDINLQIIAHGIGIPLRPTEKMLDTVRGSITGLLGELPAVHALYRTEQPLQISDSALARLGAWKAISNQMLKVCNCSAHPCAWAICPS
jgi:hypothetical protein